MKRTKKGFTLAELLVVVAIIAILVAVAIPVFSGALEKAREATDAANIRAAYAQLTVKYLEEGTENTTGITVNLVQKEAGWKDAALKKTVNDLFKDGATGDPVVGKTATLTMAADGDAKIVYNT